MIQNQETFAMVFGAAVERLAGWDNRRRPASDRAARRADDGKLRSHRRVSNPASQVI